MRVAPSVIGWSTQCADSIRTAFGRGSAPAQAAELAHPAGVVEQQRRAVRQEMTGILLLELVVVDVMCHLRLCFDAGRGGTRSHRPRKHAACNGRRRSGGASDLADPDQNLIAKAPCTMCAYLRSALGAKMDWGR